VVTFASDEEFQAVTRQFDAGVFWVGLGPQGGQPVGSHYTPIDVSYEPGWSPRCTGCYAFTNDPNVPLVPFSDASTGDAGPAGCIVASSDPQQPWKQYPCSVATVSSLRVMPPRVICEFEPVGKQSRLCDAGVCIELAYTHPVKHYVYQSNSVSADQAERACNAIGGRLVVLQSRDEREQLWRELSRLPTPPSQVWIGLSQASSVRPFSPSQWKWDDDASVDAYPSPWGDLQPINSIPGTLSLRAFLWHQSGADDTLAHNDQPSRALPNPYVCEILAAAAGAVGDQ
jgi:hypothetical protein